MAHCDPIATGDAFWESLDVEDYHRYIAKFDASFYSSDVVSV